MTFRALQTLILKLLRAWVTHPYSVPSSPQPQQPAQGQRLEQHLSQARAAHRVKAGEPGRLIGGPADQEHLSGGLWEYPCGVSTRMRPAGSAVGPCLLPGGPGVTPDALSPCKVLRGDDGKEMELEASVLPA